jgi:hypothetical protein
MDQGNVDTYLYFMVKSMAAAMERRTASRQAAKNKKRGVPWHHGKHAARELLSPDLRCFCKEVCGKTWMQHKSTEGVRP